MVRLKEREVSLPLGSIQGLLLSEITSPPPIFAVDAAQRVRSLVANRRFEHDYPALSLALSLAAYNYATFVSGVSDNQIRHFLHRFDELVGQERAAADPQNPLPTIGIEVESPRKLFEKERDGLNYANFFDVLGMPRNRVNFNLSQAFAYWEFSPPPSYTASVQTRILSELIKPGFIPSLRYSQNPEDIREYLDNKLVSLHVNLGVPLSLVGNEWNGWGSKFTKDAELFSSMFPLAFTSPLRLKSRSREPFFADRMAEPTLKDQGGIHGRFELTALEVASASNYRLISEIQLLGACMFSDWTDKNHILGNVWRDVKMAAQEIYQQYGVGPDLLKDNKPDVAKKVEESDISRHLRQVITRAATQAGKLINHL